ncbi:MAG: hypothetical protein AAFR74_03970 [Pseudomonadota bacterium]
MAGGAALPAFAHHEDIPASGNGLMVTLAVAGSVAIIGAAVYFALKTRKSA